MTIYKAYFYYSYDIKEHQMEKETKKHVYIIDEFNKKYQDYKKWTYYQYFKTWKGAHNFLLKIAHEKIQDIQKCLIEANKELKIVKEIKEK